MRLGIVDLGTNSVRFAIYKVGEGPKPECQHKRKVMVRPGQGVFRTGRLKKSTMKRLNREFEKFARQCEKAKVTEVTAVATSALREAKNSRQLIQQIFRRSGIRIRVISGRTEARLIALGILNYENFGRPPFTLIDIGGGSTEITFRGHRLTSFSVPLGSLRLHQLYSLQKATDLVTRLTEVAQMRATIQFELRAYLKSWKGRGGRLAVGSSGTIRAIGRLLDRRHAASHRNLATRRPKPRLRFRREDLRELVERMLPLSRTELARLPGMERRRLDSIVAGSVLLLEILDYLDIGRIQTSNFALRDGLLLESINRVRQKEL